jgi:iron complex transport system ATP-binding protein
MPASAAPLIEINNATVYRGDTRVFNGLTLSVKQGESTAMIGPNGAGKSTFIKLLTREVYPVVSGNSSIRILGQERPVLWDLREQIGLVSQDLQNQYLDHVPGSEIVLSGFFGSVGIYRRQELKAAHIARADDIMHELGIAGLAKRPYMEMSTGQQRRCLLGRALIHRPHSLVLDEPTSGLDLQATFQYLELVRNFIRDGGTVLLVTHHIHEIPPGIDRVVALEDGCIVADGKKSEVITSPLMSRIFDTPIEIVSANGFFQALPARQKIVDSR